MSQRSRVAVALGICGLLLLGPSPVAAQSELHTLQSAISDVAERTKASVVSITAARTRPNLPGVLPDGLPEGLPRGPRFGTSRGSGMLFRASDDGRYYYVLTNAHVVRMAADNKVKVKLVAERSERDGVVLGTDRRTDTAVIRIERLPEDDLPLVRFGSVDRLRVGALVLAVGSPFDFEASVTLGVVSSLNRELTEPGGGQGERLPEVYRGLIQTDASINPGNSGGPLVNIDGEVIGINFAIFSPGGDAGNIGIGFAIPIDRARQVIDDLIQHGHAVRGYLGVVIKDLEDQAKAMQVPFSQLKSFLGADAGAYVDRVAPNTPAARAGLRPGDVIVGVEGRPVRSTGELQDIIGQTPPGIEISVDVLRDKQELKVPVVLAELPTELTGDAPGTDAPSQARRDPLGLTLKPVDEATAQEQGIEATGLLVTAVAANSLGAAQGLVPGTVLLSGRRGDGDRVVFRSVADYRQVVDGEGPLVELLVSFPGEGGAPRSERSLLFRLGAAPEGDD